MVTSGIVETLKSKSRSTLQHSPLPQAGEGPGGGRLASSGVGERHDSYRGPIQPGCHSEHNEPAVRQFATLLVVRFRTPYMIVLLPISDFRLSRPWLQMAVTAKYQVPVSRFPMNCLVWPTSVIGTTWVSDVLSLP
jgi:hypothetical protein